jgi:hypothetical protein
MQSKIYHPVGVAHFVVVPRHELDKSLVECNTSLDVNNAAQFARDEVLRNNIFISVAEEAFHGSISSLLYLLDDLVVRGILAELDGQVDD